MNKWLNLACHRLGGPKFFLISILPFLILIPLSIWALLACKIVLSNAGSVLFMLGLVLFLIFRWRTELFHRDYLPFPTPSTRPFSSTSSKAYGLLLLIVLLIPGWKFLQQSASASLPSIVLGRDIYILVAICFFSASIYYLMAQHKTINFLRKCRIDAAVEAWAILRFRLLFVLAFFVVAWINTNILIIFAKNHLVKVNVRDLQIFLEDYNYLHLNNIRFVFLFL